LRKAGSELEIGDVLSIFHAEAERADSKAFSTLMRHPKEADPHHNVNMVQVENDIGLLGDSRDGSKATKKRFNEAVPKQLVEYLAAVSVQS
jgi:beta-galactosidase GanA